MEGYIMKKTSLLIALLLACLIVPAFAQSRKGMTPLERVKAAGWACDPSVPLRDHCFPPGAFHQDRTIQVKVYLSSDGSFLGTEILWSAEIYAGQGCPPDSIGLSVPGYFACHHYDNDF
jgi:hypothetical protein